MADLKGCDGGIRPFGEHQAPRFIQAQPFLVLERAHRRQRKSSAASSLMYWALQFPPICVTYSLPRRWIELNQQGVGNDIHSTRDGKEHGIGPGLLAHGRDDPN